MDIVYVTTNKGKVASLQRACDIYGWRVCQVSLELPEPRSSDVREIAMGKARHAYKALSQPVVVLDAGFYIPALNGFPRAYVNFALETIGLNGILSLVAGKSRECEFRECLAYQCSLLSQPATFLAHDKGMLATESRGEMRPEFWSPLAQIFIPSGFTKTLAEMSDEELARRRHQKKLEQSAERQFTAWLVESHKS